ncbi:Cof-type HAD-IIB family hydrolase [Bifidobacterium pullorum subsp. saeculare]|uniref:Cof-type HAD-IIB family hydrolase n=1 Tax=Bifidobacterium pullorum subsp. saeculare TaxID=78257 RepID=A0A938WWT4_9BIFI|nr:Cof-type HAD-IIB family hydrolase [Bifidobacterium pullorum]MBM6699030.1 Cof-type HAD-IIB family hydrolase [Bifidobacterium pullorum subsp. saeculare]
MADHGMTPDIKAVFFDIDGTLTSFVTHEVPASTIDAIHALRAKGVKVFICTGRSPVYMGVVLDALPVEFDGIVGLNGQYCADGSGFEDWLAMDPTDVATIVRWLDDHPSVACNFCERDRAYFDRVTDELRTTWAKLGRTAPKVELCDPHPRLADHAFYQISPYVDPATEAELLALCPNTAGVRWHPDFTDLIPAQGGKPRGMRRFMERYGWDRGQVMAFGDGGNDETMLAFAGIGVAMGNATAGPKAAADYVTDDVDHDGVANALRHFGVL